MSKVKAFGCPFHVRRSGESGRWFMDVAIKKVVDNCLAIHRPHFALSVDKLPETFGTRCKAAAFNSGWCVSHISTGSKVMGGIDSFKTIKEATAFAEAVISALPKLKTIENDNQLNDMELEVAMGVVRQFEPKREYMY